MTRQLAQGETMDEAVNRVDTSGDHLTSAVNTTLEDFDPHNPAVWMALADGELDQDQSRAVRQVLRNDPQTAALACAMVQAMASVGDHVREVWRRRDHAHANDIAANVMARVLAQQPKQQQPPVQSEMARPVDGAATRKLPASRPGLRPKPLRLSHSPTTRRRMSVPWSVVGVGVLAAAAGVLLLIQAGTFTSGDALSTTTTASAQSARSTPVSGSSQAMNDSPEAVSAQQDVDPVPTAAIDALDFGTHSGTVFYVPDETGTATTTVVWVTDSESGDY